MNIVMLVGQHVGQIGILAAQACGHRIIAAVPYDEDCKKIVLRLGIQAFDSVKQLRFTDGARPVLLGPLGGDENQLGEVDALVSVHGREIIPPHILDHFEPQLRWNVHPYLDTHPGADPVGEALVAADWNPLRVYAHVLEAEVDSGRVLESVQKDMSLMSGDSMLIANRQLIYHLLYPLYTALLIRMFTAANHTNSGN